MLIFPANDGATSQAEALAVQGISSAYAQLSPQGQASAFEVISSNGDGGPSALLRQQAIAGALGALVGVVAGRLIFGGR